VRLCLKKKTKKKQKKKNKKKRINPYGRSTDASSGDFGLGPCKVNRQERGRRGCLAEGRARGRKDGVVI
jgi:hypothetical protein